MVDQHVYLDILKRNLKKFIKENHHSTNKVLFSPEKASAHHDSTVTTWLENEGTAFVPKHDNLPNRPQERPIERKMKVSERGWTAKNKIDLAKRIKTAEKLPANVR